MSIKKNIPESKSDTTIHELSPDLLRWNCPETIFDFNTTEDIEPLNKIVGQPRAIEAIRLGAELFSKGYNIFVSGLSGTGRLSTVQKILRNVATSCPTTYDYCYVNNFKNNDQPSLIKLPKANGKEFANTMNDAISFLRRRLPKLFEEDSYKTSRRKIIEEYQEKERDILKSFDDRIKPFGFIRGQIENEQGIAQPEVFPIINDKPVQIDDIDEFVNNGSISPIKAEEFRTLYVKFHNEIYDLARVGIKLMQDFKKVMNENDKSAAQIEVDSVLNEIKDKFNSEKVYNYIDEVKYYILNNLAIFVSSDNQVSTLTNNDLDNSDSERFQIFAVNVILDNSQTDSYPIVIETTPSYTNMFGTIEKVYDKTGFWRTDFSKIKGGSILNADQGYIIVNANDLFSEPGVWTALKRVLLYNKLEIQPFDTYFQFSQTILKPEPIEVNVKVVIIGGQTLYNILYHYEKGFKKIFKVNAQFDHEIERTEEMLNYYARFIAKICRQENLPHCTPDGVAAIIEWAIEHAGTKNKISLKFSDVADILRESAFYDKNSNDKYITRNDVQKAIEWRRFRNNLFDDKIKNHIINGNLLIDTSGERIGQINGLTIMNTGILEFGKPARITAIVSAGTSGIINIEREVELSGSSHNKGVLILSAILRDRFASKKPMNLTASIAFEQNYSGIDGDSATAAEIYILISAIANIPIKQSFAITGSLNQKGDIQPIGGVNEKIRGFFEICESRGLDGSHAVIIPHQNINDLMLPSNIIQAINNKLFHIYAISKFEEGIELLMALPAGKLMDNGSYTKNSVFEKVAIRLDELRKESQKSSSNNNNKKKKSNKSKSNSTNIQL